MNPLQKKYNRSTVALTWTLREVDREIAKVEDRIQRADTNEAYMTDAYILQELEAARPIVAKNGGDNIAFLGFPKGS